jgi:type I restriction enzyme S subunit
LISEVVTGKVKIVDGKLVKRQPEEMKDSGIEWLGMIPNEWKLKKIKYCLKKGKEGIKIGPFGSSLKLESMLEEGYKVYGQENLIKENFDIGSRYINRKKFIEMKQYELLENDIAISMMGTIGKSKIIPKDIKRGIMDSHLIRIRLNEELLDIKFLNLIIRESQYIIEQFSYNSNGSIMSGLNSSIIKNLILAIPNLKRQKEVVSYLILKLDGINGVINKIKIQIQKLKEAKQALISESVTGKIDLRDWEIKEES